MAEKQLTVGDAFGPAPMTVGDAFGDTFVEPQKSDEFTLGGKKTGIPIPDAARPVINLFEGFNKRLAQLVAAPIESIEDAFRIAGVDILEEPGDATKAVVDAFESVGISATPLEGLSQKIGQNAFDGLLTLATFAVSAPAAMIRTAVSNPSTVERVVNDLARFFLQSPGVAATAEAGAATGLSIAQEEEFGPGGEILAAMAGGMSAATVGPAVRFGLKQLPTVTAATLGAVAGSPAGLPGAVAGAGLAGVVAKKGTGAAIRAGQRLLGRVPPLEPEPVLSLPREGVATSAAAQSVEAELVTAEREIAAIMSKLPQQSAEEASVALRAGLDNAVKRARIQESAGYTEEFLAETTAAKPLVEAAQDMLSTLKAKSPGTPTEQLERVIAEFMAKGVAKEVTAGEIQAFRSDLLDAARSNGAGPNPSRRMVRNLNILADAALDSMKAVDEQVIDAARATSRRLNELFFRGPMGRVMRKTAGGEPTIAEEVTGEALMRRPAGFRQIGAIAKEFGAQDVEGLTRDSIRALFRVAAEQDGKSAQIFMRRNASALDSFADEAIKLQGLADGLASAHAAKAAVQKGALANFAAADPQIGIKRVFSSANPARSAREILTKISSSSEAAEGFRGEILAELFRRNGFSAVKLKADLASGKSMRLVEAILPKDMIKRLKNIVNTAANVETGEARVPGVGVPILGPILGLVARVVSVGVAKRFSTRGLTVQEGGAAATFGKTFVQRITGKIDPATAFARAVADPQFERLMLTATPVTAKEIIALNRSLRALIGTKTAISGTITKKREETAR